MDLPMREGERPRTSEVNPHQQLTQNPTPAMHELLLARAFGLPHVVRRPSAISVPGAQALWLSEEDAKGPAEAFLIGREFAHIHPPYDGSLHAMLPPATVGEVLAKGWGEHHPMVHRGLLPPTNVMIYAPRTEAEVDTVLRLIGISARFARGDHSPEAISVAK